MDSPLFLDTSFAQIPDTEWQNLFQFAKNQSFHQKRDDLFTGKKINQSENRPVLHTALRNLAKKPVYVDDANIMPMIEAVWEQINSSCHQFVGVTDIIHIGIGGSDFGPRLVCDALQHLSSSDKNQTRVHFLSNVDSADLASILEKTSAQSTRIIIVSKAFDETWYKSVFV
jgi:glucose-6-phosphate isomerase